MANRAEPNPASAKEQAEGSRETVTGSINEEPGSGIPNRPPEEQRREEVPPRGSDRSGQ